MSTQHNHQVIFGRKVDGCPRCEELRNGAPAVKGWGHYKRIQEQTHLEEIRTHDCKVSHCGPVCTAFDW